MWERRSRRRSSGCSAIRCDGSWSASSVAAIAVSASSCSWSGSRRTWSPTTWRSSGTPASSAPAEARPTVATSTTGPICSAAGTSSAKPGSRSIPGSRSRRRHLATSSRDGLDLDCCSCAPATAPAPRSPRPSSNTDRQAPSRHAARAATPSRCTRTRCGSWLSAASTSAGRPTKSLTRFARTRFDRVITLCDKVREICPEFPGAPIAAHWSIADPAAERQRRGDVPRVPTRRRRDREPRGSVAR